MQQDPVDQDNSFGDDGPADPDADWGLIDATEQAKALPTQFVNRIFVQPDMMSLRVTLGEQIGDDVVYRASFMVPNGAALQMGELLIKMATTGNDYYAKLWRKWVEENPEAAPSNG